MKAVRGGVTDMSSSTDPHYGNFAITLGSLQNVPERAIDETLASCNVWQTTLRRLSRDKSINCGDLYPEEAIHMHIKVIDFGRGKLATCFVPTFGGVPKAYGILMSRTS